MQKKWIGGPNNILRSCDGSISFHVPKAEGQVSPFTRSFFTLITGANGKKCLGTTKTIFWVKMITFSHIMPVFNDKVHFFHIILLIFIYFSKSGIERNCRQELCILRTSICVCNGMGLKRLILTKIR